MWEAIKDFTFWCINAFYQVFHDWGVAIIVITLIVRLILMPLMQKQIKASYHMNKLSPKIQELKEKYKDDPVRMNEEMQRLYAESKFNPVAGCLPLLIQMPIFIALYNVLGEMGARVQGSTYEFYHIVPDLTLHPSTALGAGVLTFIPYLILLVLFSTATFLPMILQQKGQPDSPQKKQMMIMSAFMSVFMLWIGWNAPAGVLLYWVTSSLFAIAQQQITMAVLKKEDAAKEAEIEVKPVAVEVVRKPKKKRPTKSR